MRVGSYNFPLVDYDRFGDIVYLRTAEGVDGESRGETPEGHAFLHPFGGGDEVLGVDLENVALQLEQEGGVFITTPEGERVRLEAIEHLVRT